MSKDHGTMLWPSRLLEFNTVPIMFGGPAEKDLFAVFFLSDSPMSSPDGPLP